MTRLAATGQAGGDVHLGYPGGRGPARGAASGGTAATLQGRGAVQLQPGGNDPE